MSRLPILFVSTQGGSPWGGSEELWGGAALRLRERGWSVEASVPMWVQPVAAHERLERAGVRVQRRPPIPGTRLGRGLARLAGRLPVEVACLGRTRPDLVVVSQGYQFEGAAWVDACRAGGIPYGLVIQAALEHTWPGDTDLAYWRESFRAAAALFFVSRGNLELVESQLGVVIPNAEVVRNPFLVDYDAAPEWPAEDGVLRLACVGRVHPASKGQDLLLRVLAREEWRARDGKVQVGFFGEGPNAVGLADLARSLGVPGVRFHGRREDVEGIWRDHHALVLPSRYEGLPLVVVEAMLCGRPCVVTRVAGNAELLENGISGFVAEGATVPALALAMEALWQNRHRLREMGQAARVAARREVPRAPAGVFADRLQLLQGAVAAQRG